MASSRFREFFCYNKNMKIKELVISIKKYNTETEPRGIIDTINSEGSAELLWDIENVKDPDSAFLITDSRECADKAAKRSIGFAVYLNEAGRESDFADALYCIDNVDLLPLEQVDKMYERSRDIPWEILRTNRFVLREMTCDDLDDILAIYDHEDVSRYAGGPYKDREQSLNYIREYIANQYRFFEYGIWLVIDKISGEIVGRCGYNTREGYDGPELGYVFAKRHWGKGYAGEVIEAVLKYGFEELGFDRINAFVMPQNEVSVYLLEKFGFKYNSQVELHDKTHLWYMLDAIS